MSISGYAIIPSLSPNLDHFWLQQTLLRLGEQGGGLAASLFSQDSLTFLFSSAFLLSLPKKLYYLNIPMQPPTKVRLQTLIIVSLTGNGHPLFPHTPASQTNQLWPLPCPLSPPFSE